MEKIDVTQVILDLNGDPMARGRVRCSRCREAFLFCPKCGNSESADPLPVTLREVCKVALVSSVRGDERVDGDEKFKWFHLALRIMDNDTVELKSEEVSLLKERIAKLWNTITVGRSWEMLDPPIGAD